MLTMTQADRELRQTLDSWLLTELGALEERIRKTGEEQPYVCDN